MTNTSERDWVVEGQIDGGEWITIRIKPSGTPLRKLASGWLGTGGKGKLRLLTMEDAVELAIRRRSSFRDGRLSQRIRNTKTGEVVPVDVLVPSVTGD